MGCGQSSIPPTLSSSSPATAYNHNNNHNHNTNNNQNNINTNNNANNNSDHNHHHNTTNATVHSIDKSSHIIQQEQQQQHSTTTVSTTTTNNNNNHNNHHNNQTNTTTIPTHTISPSDLIVNNISIKPLSYKYDIFLSHKRSDTQDFARIMKSELEKYHYICFLDQDDDGDIHDLLNIVKQCRTFIFILSSNIFNSEWCMKELQQAVIYQLNILLITYPGSRWNGHEFPTDDIIPIQVKDAFKVKGIDIYVYVYIYIYTHC